jgi:uncharacterized protein YjbI with pentapeptide repeats
LTGIILGGNDLTGANLAGQNLTRAAFYGATLTAADLSDAEVRGADFSNTTSTGFTATQLYSTASYRAHDLTGISLSSNNLRGWSFAGQNLTSARFDNAMLSGADFREANLTKVSFSRTNLTHANFAGQYLRNVSFETASLTNANFTGADIRGASFAAVYDPYFGVRRGTGISLAQLYSTASYQAHDLSGADFTGNDLTGANFAGQNLTNVRFGRIISNANGFFLRYDAVLAGADFTGADARGASYVNFLSLADANTTNLIGPSGHIDGLNLAAGRLLVVRDYDGYFSDGVLVPRPIPITVDQRLAIEAGSTLRLVIEADEWDSTISFAPDIPVALGGNLELTFAGDVDLASQVGRSLDLFDWTGVTASGLFNIASPHIWDLSQLYTTGDVTLAAVGPLPGDYNGNGIVDAADSVVWRASVGSATLLNRSPHLAGPVGPSDFAFWKANFGRSLGSAATGAASAVSAIPEPATTALAALGLFGLIIRRRQQTPRTNPGSKSDEESHAEAQRRRGHGINPSSLRPQRLCVSLFSILVFTASESEKYSRTSGASNTAPSSSL